MHIYSIRSRIRCTCSIWNSMYRKYLTLFELRTTIFEGENFLFPNLFGSRIDLDVQPETGSQTLVKQKQKQKINKL